MNKLRVTIENYKALWKEPDFRWLQEFNWLIAARKVTRSLFETAALFYITTVLAVFYFFIKSKTLLTLTAETDFTKKQIENTMQTFSMLVNSIVAIALMILLAKLAMNWHDYDTEKTFSNRYKKISFGLHFDEKIKGNNYSLTRVFRTLKRAFFLLIFSFMIQFGEISKIVSMDFVHGMSLVVLTLFGLWMMTRLLIYLKFKKWAKEFKTDIHILTTERDFIRLINQMDSLLILPEKWKNYMKQDQALFTQSVKRTDIEIEGEPVNDVVSKLEVIYLVPFTSIRIVYFIQLVEFETEVELQEYKKTLEEAYDKAPGKGPSAPEIKVLLANLKTDNLNRIKADSLSKKIKK